MADETRAGAAGHPPAAAADFVRGRAAAERARAALLGRATRVHDLEGDALLAWAGAERALLPAGFLGNFFRVSEGAEHQVFFDRASLRAIKATLPSRHRFGHSAFGPLVGATPLEYLERLAWHNAIFGDAIGVLGVIVGDDYLQVVTSQPWITAHPIRARPFAAELEAYFLEFGFERLPPAYPNAFFSPGLGLVALDAHDANVLRDETEQLSPIDLVIGRPGPRFAREIEALRPRR